MLPTITSIQDALIPENDQAASIAGYLHDRGFSNARAIPTRDGFGVEVSPGRMVIIDPNDCHSDRKIIERKIISKAKGGDLEAVRFLLDHSDFEFPDFKVNGNHEADA